MVEESEQDQIVGETDTVITGYAPYSKVRTAICTSQLIQRFFFRHTCALCQSLANLRR